ncbi:IS30 family transposase [Rhizobium halophytocola]|uniref:IS30 family transposase n=1 Tax=Rhizobium halophytocola TaxID=735519 RepID=A0ABS4E4C4_9HYPH|nr:IS30 family transposase [Rhizobium halophytocola]
MAWNTTDFKNDGKGRIAAAPITAAIPDIDYRTSINVLARHRLRIGASSWFCDPSAPWQKGTVENTNKRLRRFLPGNTDLASVSQRDLSTLARHLNDQPRKCLGYKTPAEVLLAHLHANS